tara:strand:- start:8145 stop:8354 length:210 start_codon:yes stop_codon:yes gene_type:complete
MDITELPTLFQIGVAQESNAQSIESLHTLFLKQQEMIEHQSDIIQSLRELLDAHQSLLEDIVGQIKKSK